MLSTLVSFATLALLATASPLAERQSGVQVVRNCNNQGQVALTFDGMFFVSLLALDHMGGTRDKADE
jgi:hypothetical protein